MDVECLLTENVEFGTLEPATIVDIFKKEHEHQTT
jgi:hypothetical protein